MNPTGRYVPPGSSIIARASRSPAAPAPTRKDLFGSPLPRPADAIAPEFPETPADAKERNPEEAEDIVENHTLRGIR